MDTLQLFLIVEYADEVPVANFTATPTTGVTPLEVQFSDTSTGYITSYNWDFNNDGTVDSTDQNPTWTYTNPGTYTVKLTVSGPGGTNEIVKTDYITANMPELTDLIITDIKANSGLGNYMFANEPNVIDVTVKNNGTADSGATTLNITVNGTTYTVNVPALATGASTTVTITDTTEYAGGGSVPVSANADPLDNIPETNETNNVFQTTITVYNNGYKGKQYTDDDDIDDMGSNATFSGKLRS
jgi:PKD repeat protein